jgi:hypothetical protein
VQVTGLGENNSVSGRVVAVTPHGGGPGGLVQVSTVKKKPPKTAGRTISYLLPPDAEKEIGTALQGNSTSSTTFASTAVCIVKFTFLLLLVLLLSCPRALFLFIFCVCILPSCLADCCFSSGRTEMLPILKPFSSVQQAFADYKLAAKMEGDDFDFDTALMVYKRAKRHFEV